MFNKIVQYIINKGKCFFAGLLRKKILTKKQLSGVYKIKQLLSYFLPKEQRQINLINHHVNYLQNRLLAPKISVIENKKNGKRVSLFIMEVNFQYFSGGYIGMFQFAKFLRNQGYRLRLITTDYCETDLNKWRLEIKKYKGLENFFEDIEIENIYYRDGVVNFESDEILIATSIITAQIVNHIREQLKTKKFIFLIQEYESLFFPSGSLSALSDESYTFPHFAVFSTEILRQYFKSNSIGVFSSLSGDDNSVSFKNSIVALTPDKNLHQRKTKKLLFYFRPEEHAARNMYETGLIALKQAIEEGYFEKHDWEFYGIGSLLPVNSKIKITQEKSLIIIPKVNLKEYTELMPEFDLGLSLMLSPHPSLVPIEMCSVGMVTVTNTYANKNERALKSISENFICASPTIDSIKNSLKTAVMKVEDIDERIENSRVNWPDDWGQVFNDDFFKKTQNFL
ncbi:MAG: hypothetical protein DRJ10_11820 [Bacteroidetes bacterium]|nr:MAG: hypothetical protein DRJ10_11820 [Bacteroidota bacterium]